MYNLLISLAAGLLVAVAIRLGGFGWVAVIIPGVLGTAIAYVALNLRAQKRLSAKIEAAVAEAQARRFDRAIQMAKGALAMGPWLFGSQAAISALIGQFLWWKGENEAALPYLEAAAAGQWPTFQDREHVRGLLCAESDEGFRRPGIGIPSTRTSWAVLAATINGATRMRTRIRAKAARDPS